MMILMNTRIHFNIAVPSSFPYVTPPIGLRLMVVLQPIQTPSEVQPS